MGLLDEYFSGKEDLISVVSWPLRFGDSSIRKWIAGAEGGCLVLQLSSYLSSAKQRKGNTANASRFGYLTPMLLRICHNLTQILPQDM